MSPSNKTAAKASQKKTAAKSQKAAPKKAAKATKAKTAAKKSAKPVKKATAKKAATKKTTAKKATAKKASKETTKSSPKKASPKAAGKVANKTTTAKPSKKAGATGTKTKAKTKAQEKAKRARAKKLLAPTGPRHPKLGFRWTCFSCATKFYDLGKEDPICPKCEENQNHRPAIEPKQTPGAPKSKVVRPMAQLLDDEEPVPRLGEADADTATGPKKAKEDPLFDQTEADEAGMDIDDADSTDMAEEPPEIDAI